jgi:hypothetical protein
MIRSDGGILHLGRSKDLITKVAAQVFRCAEIHRSADDGLDLELHARERKQSRRLIRLEFDQHIDIALRPEPVGEHRSEERKAADVVPVAEPDDKFTIELDVRGHQGDCIAERCPERRKCWMSRAQTAPQTATRFVSKVVIQLGVPTCGCYPDKAGSKIARMVQFASALICGIAIAVVSAVVTVRLALHRFYSEKWWEKKLAAYVNVIEALFQVKLYMDEQIESYVGESTISEERQVQLREKWREGRDEISRAAAIGTFLMSAHATEVLERLLKELDEADTADNFLDYAGAELSAVNRGLAEIRELAKADLNVT